MRRFLLLTGTLTGVWLMIDYTPEYVLRWVGAFAFIGCLDTLTRGGTE